MAHQNRVNPFGDLIATPERGTLYGNRGVLVDKNGKIARRYKDIRWITCVLDFKGRRHPMMAPGRYTGLFFLDEATALAARHRPCAECQRDRFNLFRSHWAKANPFEAKSEKPLAPLIDAILQGERRGSDHYSESIDELPDGTFVTNNEVDSYLILNGKLLHWAPGGYISEELQEFDLPIRILTPASVVRALDTGYPVTVHSSASPL